jgi:hypothetical protein
LRVAVEQSLSIGYHDCAAIHDLRTTE